MPGPPRSRDLRERVSRPRPAELFVDEDEAIQLRVKQLMAAYQNPKMARGIAQADPFVIALAATQEGEMARGLRLKRAEASPKTRTFPRSADPSA
jgi:hypothetical protein